MREACERLDGERWKRFRRAGLRRESEQSSESESEIYKRAASSHEKLANLTLLIRREGGGGFAARVIAVHARGDDGFRGFGVRADNDRAREYLFFGRIFRGFFFIRSVRIWASSGLCSRILFYVSTMQDLVEFCVGF